MPHLEQRKKAAREHHLQPDAIFEGNELKTRRYASKEERAMPRDLQIDISFVGRCTHQTVFFVSSWGCSRMCGIIFECMPVLRKTATVILRNLFGSVAQNISNFLLLLTSQ